jgi:hypothetical protein
MDGEFTIQSLKILDMPGTDNEYTLTLNDELSIIGTGTSAVIENGKVVGGKMTIGDAWIAQFDWKGGTLQTEVDVLELTRFRVEGPTYKELKGFINNYSGDASWDGKGDFWIMGTSSYLWNKSGATFTVGTIDTTADAEWGIVGGNAIRNDGTFNVAMPAGKKLSFFDPGWVYNFGTWNVTSGKMSARNLQNSGVIELSTGTEFYLGASDGTGKLDSTASPTGQSIIKGAGKAIFPVGATIEIPGGAARVKNVEDYGKEVSGAGDLVIDGEYKWSQAVGQNSTSVWKGAGKTIVGPFGYWSDIGWLRFEGKTHMLQRTLINYGVMDWEFGNLDVGSVSARSIELGQNGSIENKSAACFNITGLAWTKQSITRVAGNGTLKNAGEVNARFC